jgi:hypothetical protein
MGLLLRTEVKTVLTINGQKAKNISGRNQPRLSEFKFGLEGIELLFFKTITRTTTRWESSLR